MKASYTFIIGLMVCAFANAQSINGRVVDSESLKPILYVNIGIVNKNVGTVSLEDGQFEIPLENKFDNDTLRFSCIGYEAKSFLVGDFKKLFQNSTTISLISDTVLLNEVVITNKPNQVITLGHPPKSKFTKAGFFYNRLGHEIGTLFENIDASLSYLDSVQLNFVNCLYDSIFIRLNVYTVEEETIKNILPQNILIGMEKKRVLSRPVINLTDYYIPIGHKFLVSIEIVHDLGTSGLKFFAVLKAEKNKAYYRGTSHDQWAQANYKEKPIGISILAFLH